jgi:E1A/CREB-binding protein
LSTICITLLQRILLAAQSVSFRPCGALEFPFIDSCGVQCSTYVCCPRKDKRHICVGRICSGEDQFVMLTLHLPQLGSTLYFQVCHGSEGIREIRTREFLTTGLKFQFLRIKINDDPLLYRLRRRGGGLLHHHHVEYLYHHRRTRYRTTFGPLTGITPSATASPLAPSRCQMSPSGQTMSITGMKRLWKHLAECKDLKCLVPHCVTSRYVLSHYHRCKDVKCPVCGPVREAIQAK